MTPRELAEYRALRDTIRERSTVRIWIVLAGLTSWSALTLAAVAGAPASQPVSTLVALLVLSVTFEIVFALHTGVERIGRYIQVFFESEADRGWEHQAMAYGREFPGGSDPLFAAYFWAAILLNILPAALAGPGPLEWVAIGTLHLLIFVRIMLARRQAGQQRSRDLERFRRLKEASPETTSGRARS